MDEKLSNIFKPYPMSAYPKYPLRPEINREHFEEWIANKGYDAYRLQSDEWTQLDLEYRTEFRLL